MKSKHMVIIPIGYYLCDSCIDFLIGISIYVIIDINYLFINVIQVGEYCIYIISYIKVLFCILLLSWINVNQ